MADVVVLTLVSLSLVPNEVIPPRTRVTLDANTARRLIERGQAIDPDASGPVVTVAQPAPDPQHSPPATA